MGSYILNFLYILINIMMFAIIGRALLSWFPINPENPLVKVLNEVTEPVLAPFRRVIPRLGMIDISPMVAIIVLQVLGSMLRSA